MNKDRIIPQHNGEFSSRDEARAKVTDVFKRVDILLKNGDIIQAQEELKRANQQRKESFKKNPLSIFNKENYVLPETPLPLKPLDAMNNSFASQKKNYSMQTDNFVTNKNVIQENKTDRSYELKSYRDAIIEALRKGPLTPNDLRQLEELKTILEISEAEHNFIKNEIDKIYCKDINAKQISDYTQAQRTNSISNQGHNLSGNNRQEIKEFQNQPNQKIKQYYKILVIDDDIPFLKLLSSSIAEEGFEIYAMPTSDQALQLLSQVTPDMILCDINLKSSSINGIVFYRKIQEYKHLQRIPFIFITGFANEEILRMVKESGADDCLIKPFSKHVMLSSIRGKLKRFNQLNSAHNK